MNDLSSRRVAALTGGAGCGKSVVAALFAEFGARVIDADGIAHQLTGPNGAAMPALVEAFGPSAATPVGALNRPWMRHLILSDATAKRTLELVLHPAISEQIVAAVLRGPADALHVIEIPLLFETMGYRHWIRWNVAIDCPISLQRARLKARSALSESEIDGLLAAQVPRFIRLQLADCILTNVGTPGSLRPGVELLYERWTRGHPNLE